ncbi:Protein FAM49B [Nibea albiflora]|uniref:Protein FAM49B n=1 Tax=Nibea albiflora TaxID=240163 RepID=A0ACB7F6A0_NIBAL|nr:Protein FAM49B [Nibea albiflora]
MFHRDRPRLSLVNSSPPEADVLVKKVWEWSSRLFTPCTHDCFHPPDGAPLLLNETARTLQSDTHHRPSKNLLCAPPKILLWQHCAGKCILALTTPARPSPTRPRSRSRSGLRTAERWQQSTRGGQGDDGQCPHHPERARSVTALIPSEAGSGAAFRQPARCRRWHSRTFRYRIMGNLLKVLTCTDLEQEPNFFLDFENAQPTDAEREVWDQVDVVLKDAKGILDELQAYKGAGQEIREAIQNPNDEALQEQAWAAVVPLVGKLKKFYEFSQRLEAALHSLLGALTSETYDDTTQHLEREQALAKQFAEILHFTLRFDELKMTNPAIQNDFSYYRRTLSRMRINNVPAEGENEVNNELANRISLFYADATPMLKTLSDGTTKFVSENKNLPIENTTDCLSTMATVCKVMLETPEYRSRFSSEETVSFCLRVMVGVIILYDYVHPVGAFAKSSKIDMKGCIKVLKDQPPNSVEGLLNALRADGAVSVLNLSLNPRRADDARSRKGATLGWALQHYRQHVGELLRVKESEAAECGWVCPLQHHCTNRRGGKEGSGEEWRRQTGGNEVV